MLTFNPTGLLDISTDPSDLPEVGDGKNTSSDALTRCKNLHQDRSGLAITRPGSLKINSTAIDTDIRHIREQSGNRYAFTGDQIYENETSITSGLTDADWSSILYNAFNDTTEQVYALNGTDRKRIESGVVHNWGLTAPTDTPVATDADGGSLTGAYSIKYTLAGKSGSTVIRESNPSSASNSVTLATEALQVTFDRPNEQQVTHVRVYRTAAGGTTYTLDQDYAVPYIANEDFVYTYSFESADAYISGTGNTYTTTSGTYEITHSWESDITTDTNIYFANEMWSFEPVLYIGYSADGNLSGTIPSTNSRPPAGTYVAGPAYDGTCFIVKDNLLYYCPAKQPEYWPSTYFIEVSPVQFPGKMVVFQNGQPYYLTVNEIYYIQGTGVGTFFPLPMKAKTGTQSVQGAVSVRGFGIFHVGPDGIYLFSGTDDKFTQPNLDPIFKGEAVNGIPAVTSLSTSWLFHRGSKLYFGYTSSGNSYPTNVLVFNLDRKRVSYYNYNDLAIRTITEDETNDRILIGDNTGFIRRIENVSDTDDDGTAISWEAQSKDFTLSTRYIFPRWTKYDVEVTSGTAQGDILLDGSSVQTHTITGSRTTTRRQIATSNGRRLANKLSGSGVVKIYLTETE